MRCQRHRRRAARARVRSFMPTACSRRVHWSASNVPAWTRSRRKRTKNARTREVAAPAVPATLGGWRKGTGSPFGARQSVQPIVCLGASEVSQACAASNHSGTSIAVIAASASVPTTSLHISEAYHAVVYEDLSMRRQNAACHQRLLMAETAISASCQGADLRRAVLPRLRPVDRRQGTQQCGGAS